MLRPPLTPMLAAPVAELPTGRQLAYEPKWDGWRALAFRDDSGVRLQSRAGRDLTGYFPDVARTLGWLPAGTVLDGELIVWAEGRTDFALLQRRVTAGRGLAALVDRHPAHFVAFDLLSGPDGEPLLDVPLAERRRRLAALLGDAPAGLVLCPQTGDPAEAREWLRTWTDAGVEGIVVKRCDGRYEPGRRGWQKVRAHHTVETLVGGVTGPVSDPDTLLIGRCDERGRLRYLGRTHPLRRQQRRELAGLLQPTAAPGHPWPQPLPGGWTGQLNPAPPLPYTPVRQDLVVEVEADTAYEHGRWRHRVRHLRPRLDLAADDLPPLTDGPEALGAGGTDGVATDRPGRRTG
ncbi:ATP-dependent DNA ligase [Micromonospora halotolerans]|uniref:ATP-dependent DNA ligase n=1 Tax=Micromonospora halotolerans TaxID=709879 RepID=A0ABY9ZXX8_9ACTN|nr:ATP-dependent DNA ligase [Micromonospora halotolerans]WNM40149.1 ATP-dependent DNA ligase [Micromonospora halotolerans]